MKTEVREPALVRPGEAPRARFELVELSAWDEIGLLPFGHHCNLLAPAERWESLCSRCKAFLVGLSLRLTLAR